MTHPSLPSGTQPAHRRVGYRAHEGPLWIPILPRHKISLFWLDGDGYRFAELFAQTWVQIPLAYRRTLLKFWRTTRPTFTDLHWPSIELIAGKSDYARGNSGLAVAQYNFIFHSFSFDSRYMDWLSDASVKTVIAHELAHAVLIDEDADYHLENSAYDGLGFSQAEYDADELANFWGFDTDARDAELEQLPILNHV